MKRSKLKLLIKEAVTEAIILKRYGDDIVAVSDLNDPKEQSKETFKKKNALKNAGFRWDGKLRAWKKSGKELDSAVKTAKQLNPKHAVISAIENLPEFILNQEFVDKKTELAAKIDKYIDELMDDVDSVTSSEEFQKFMDFNSRFRKYSFNNTLLIYMQKPTAKRVAGFNAWKKLHRQVQKGSKAIYIFAPMSKKVEEKQLDNAVKEKKYTFFRPVKVFDISDTEAIDERGDIPNLDWHANSEPNEVANKIVESTLVLADNMGIDVTQDSAKGGEQGYSAGDKINLSSNIDGVEKAATFIHEVAHELLHWKDKSMFHIETKNSAEKELQAESVAYLVLRHYDLPVKQMANYLAMWKANKDSIKAQLQTLKKTADFVITELDKIAEK